MVVQQDSVAGRRVISVGYRFVLAPDVVPGSYAWPLTMRARGRVSGHVEQSDDERWQGTAGMQSGYYR
jgi:hypothetical protein